MKTQTNHGAAIPLETTGDQAVAPSTACSRFAARMVACMKIQNSKNQGTPECAEWIAQDREFALRTALDQVTAGIGIMVIAGVDPEKLLTRWMELVECRNPDASNANSQP